MAREIERKFLLVDERWRREVTHSVSMRQGYLAGDERCSVRVRREDGQARLNIKSATLGVAREEFEYPIPVADADFMLAELCTGGVLEKIRHHLVHAGAHWEIDEFAGANAGLVVAEIELTAADQDFVRPPWLGVEVSALPRYYNVCLIERPYVRWSAAEKA
jgi:adenylate cyclase